MFSWWGFALGDGEVCEPALHEVVAMPSSSFSDDENLDPIRGLAIRLGSRRPYSLSLIEAIATVYGAGQSAFANRNSAIHCPRSSTDRTRVS